MTSMIATPMSATILESGGMKRRGIAMLSESADMVSSPFETSDFFGLVPSQRCAYRRNSLEPAGEPESPKIGSFVPQWTRWMA